MREQRSVVFLFHLYQPPWQSDEIFESFYQASYLPLLEIIKKQNLKITLNLTGSLVEFLERHNKTAFRDLLAELVLSGAVELTGSAMYHVLLPLTPQDIVIRQIRQNTEVLERYLGAQLHLAGFYLPELANSREALRIVKDEGFEWVAIDDTALETMPNKDDILEDSETGLKLLVNDSVYRVSDSSKFDQQYNTLINDGEYQVTENRLELGWIRCISEHKNPSEYKLLTASELLALPRHVNSVRLRDSNWQMGRESWDERQRFGLWDNPDNKIHQEIWNFITEVNLMVDKYKEDANIQESKSELDRGYSSCTWWWADGRILGYNPTAIESGLKYMINAVRALIETDLADRLKCEKMYSDLLYDVWCEHWRRRQK